MCVPDEFRIFFWLIVLTFFCACTHSPNSPSYREQYAYLKMPLEGAFEMCETPFFLVLLVEARHLDYSDSQSLLKTLTKHPSNASKNGDVGHAWIYLQGELSGRTVFLEGGHSGELGIMQTRYFEGVYNNMNVGYANPTPEQVRHPRKEPNPIKYLWEMRKDGFFQKGCGGHNPTFAAKIDLTEKQFKDILGFIQNYPYQNYSLTTNQCASFVASEAQLAHLSLEHQIGVHISQKLAMAGERLTLWTDPFYSYLVISSPDVLEKSLIAAVKEGKAENALRWYRKKHSNCSRNSFEEIVDTLKYFPVRLKRYLSV